MDRVIVAAFVATFIAAVAAVVGMPVFAQEVPPPATTMAPDVAPGGMRARFAAMDTDHDGRVSRAEWLAAGRKERGFAMMDANGDGFVTTDEMKAGRAKMQAMRQTKAQ